MSTIVKNIHIFKNGAWHPIKKVFKDDSWRTMKGIFYEGDWYEIGTGCVIMPDGCIAKRDTHPRWDENATHYGTNNFGFDVIPAGIRDYYSGFFQRIGKEGGFWCSDPFPISFMYDTSGITAHSNQNKKEGYSVRCVKDYTGSQSNGTILTNDYTDGSGNKYDAVVIGKQLWTIKNLYTTKYQNGTNIPNVTVNGDWTNLTTGAYCWYDNNYATWGQYYGAIYNWYAMDGLVNNNGYRVSSNGDWETLSGFLIQTDWCNGVSITRGNVGQYLKSCRQVNHPLQKLISVEPTSLTFDYKAQTKYVKVTSEANWVLENNTASVTTNVTSGTTGVTNNIAIIIEKNTTDLPKYGTIVFNNGDNQAILTITQDKYIQPADAISISPTTLSFPSGGGSKTITVTSSDYWSADVLAWVISPIGGNAGTNTITIAATPNNGGAPRSGSITFTRGTKSATLFIEQM